MGQHRPSRPDPDEDHSSWSVYFLARKLQKSIDGSDESLVLAYQVLRRLGAHVARRADGRSRSRGGAVILLRDAAAGVKILGPCIEFPEQRLAIARGLPHLDAEARKHADRDGVG